jgi:hypothetical protein
MLAIGWVEEARAIWRLRGLELIQLAYCFKNSRIFW